MSPMEQEDKKHQKEMPFLEHLEELRWRLIRSIVALISCSILAFVFREYILDILVMPFEQAKEMHAASTTNSNIGGAKLMFLSPPEGFIVYIKLSIFAGMFFCSPYVFYQLWKFIAPGLIESEKKYVPYFVFFSTFFFMAGSVFCHTVVLRYGLTFLLGFQTEMLEAHFAIREYLKFVTLLILTFGIVFEMPILSFFLTKVGILTPDFMRRNRRYSVVLIFLTAAILTPPDWFTQIMLALPLLLLYEFSIFVSKAALPGKAEDD